MKAKKITAIALALVLALSFATTAFARYKGDVTNDGSVNSSDALLVLRYAVGAEKEIDKAVADMNSDDKINSSDALAILQISVGMVDKEEIPEQPEVPEEPEVQKTTEEIVALYNDSINKVVNEKAGYKKARTATIHEMNGGALMKIQLVVDMVNEFLGVGTQEYVNAKGQSRYLMNASLTKNDVTSATLELTGDNYTVTLLLKDGSSSATAAAKKDTSALARSGLLTGNLADTNYDYLSSSCIYESIMGANASVSVNSVKATNSNVKFVAVINPQGELISLNASYDWTVAMTKIKYTVVSVKEADGKAHTEVEFTDFSW